MKVENPRETVEKTNEAVSSQKMPSRVDVTMKVDSTTPYRDHFLIEGNRITMNQKFTTNYSQLVLNLPIPKTGSFSFKWKIIKAYSSSIFIGIIPKELRNYRVSHFHRQAFSILGKKGLVFSNKRNGFHFGQSDVIEVTVDRQQSSIEWKIEAKDLQTKVVDKLIAQLDFIPFIQMLEKGDQIEWLGYQNK